MSIIGDIAGIASSIAGANGAKKKNAAAAANYSAVQGLTNQESGVANTIASYLASLAKTSSSTYTDPLSTGQQAVQDASYNEELSRNTMDQDQRRGALQDTERLRQENSRESDQALRDVDALRSGVGKIDPVALANTMRLSRTSAVNAGYDDAAHAAQALSLRTGTNAGDALSEIARNRTKDIATTLGDPTSDALTQAQALNDAKTTSAQNSYNLFNQKANNFYDSSFTPSTYAETAKADAQKDQALDLQKYDTLFGGSTNQGSLYGQAANTISAAGNAKIANTNSNITGQLIQGVGNGVNGLATDVATAGKGGFNMSSLLKMFGG